MTVGVKTFCKKQKLNWKILYDNYDGYKPENMEIVIRALNNRKQSKTVTIILLILVGKPELTTWKLAAFVFGISTRKDDRSIIAI